MEDLLHARVKMETTDVQLLSLSKEEVSSEPQVWSPSLAQDDPPEGPRVKEEHKELWISQEGEQLQGLEEADISEFAPTPFPVKNEDNNEENPQFSQIHHAEEMKAEADGEDCGVQETDGTFYPDNYLQPDTDDEMSQSSDLETDDSCDWKATGESQGTNSLELECDTKKIPVSSSECSASFFHKKCLQEHSEIQTGVKTFGCSVCGKKYLRKRSLKAHMRLHSDEKSFSCSVCLKTFAFRGHIVRHMRVHTGEKPFSCSECGTKFTQQGSLRDHLRTHTGEKPFSCSVCTAKFTQQGSLRDHVRTHTGEKPFICSVCSARFTHRSNLATHIKIHNVEKLFNCSVCCSKFTQKEHLKKHLRTHTGEKPFNCSVCGKGFGQSAHLRRHLRVHTGEKPFICNVCDKSFTQQQNLKQHKCVGETSGRKLSCSQFLQAGLTKLT